MKEKKSERDLSAPVVTEGQLAELKAKLAAASREPIRQVGEVSRCVTCGGRMVTTNDLDRAVAAPGLVFVVARLPGARCSDCGSTELDGSGVAILAATAPRDIWADYETAVTHASGNTLGTYFKMDLARVLGLSGAERLFWKVLDRDRALVQVQRKDLPLTRVPSSRRPRVSDRSSRTRQSHRRSRTEAAVEA